MEYLILEVTQDEGERIARGTQTHLVEQTKIPVNDLIKLDVLDSIASVWVLVTHRQIVFFEDSDLATWVYSIKVVDSNYAQGFRYYQWELDARNQWGRIVGEHNSVIMCHPLMLEALRDCEAVVELSDIFGKHGHWGYQFCEDHFERLDGAPETFGRDPVEEWSDGYGDQEIATQVRDRCIELGMPAEVLDHYFGYLEDL